MHILNIPSKTQNMWNHKRPRTAKEILREKNKAGDIILPDFPVQFSSVAQCVRLFATHEPQHARPPCPSPTPGVQPNPCPLSW